MKLLITGGMGFIGSHFIKFIANEYKHYHIINLDKLTYAANRNNLLSLKKSSNYTFVEGDICDSEFVNQLVHHFQIDAIVNFAAESHVDRSFDHPHVFAQTNFIGTQSLLNAAVQHKVKKYVQISTDEVYGELGKTGYFNEETPLAPNNPYSASKAGADLMVRAYFQTYGLNINFARFANTYGPFQYPEKLIPMTITNALENSPVLVHGKGGSIRDWLFVQDNVRAIDSILHKGKAGETYNIGMQEERKTLDVVERILEIMNKPKNLIEFVEERPSQDYRYANDPSKIMADLNWKPAYSFESGLLHTINWYKEHYSWWTSLKAASSQKALVKTNFL